MAETDNYFDSQQFKSILKRYEDAENMGQALFFDSDDLADIAEYYYNNGNKAKATSILDEAIATFPGSALPLVLRARTALTDEHDTEKARQYAAKVADRLDLDYLYLEAEILLTEHRDDEADQYLFEHMEKIDEDDVPDYVLDVASLFADYGNMALAQTWLNRSDESDLADYQELKGRIAYSKGRYEESEKIFEKLLDENPYSGRLWNSLASTQYMREHIDDAISSSEFSIAINPNDEDAILNKANGLFRLGNYQEALKYYQRFIELCPEDECGYLYRGNTLLSLDRPHEALEQYRLAEQKARKGSTSLPEIYQDLAFTLSMLNHPEEALGYIDKAEQLPDIDHSELEVMRGHIFLEHNRTTEAQQCFTTALNDSNHSSEIFLKVSISIYECGYTSIAYRMLKALLESEEETWTDGYAYLALCCKQLNKRREFLANLQTACQKNAFEAKLVLGDLFPADLRPQQYYDYALQHDL